MSNHLPEQTNEWSDEEYLRNKYWSSFKPGDVIIDIGAYKGLYTLQALSQGCTVISVEPMKTLLDEMIQSVKMNDGFIDRLTYSNSFVWKDQDYPEMLFNHMEAYCKSMNFELSKKWITLDELTKGLDNVSMIKMDVEGAELGVLEGGANMINKYHPAFIIEDHTAFFEYCVVNNTHDKIFELLKAAGYSVRDEFMLRNFIIADHNKNG